MNELKHVCSEAIVLPQFQRKGKKTYCNMAAEWIAQKVGADTSWMWFISRSHGNRYVGSANMICRQAVKEVKAGRLTEVTVAAAKELAEMEQPVILCAKSMQRGRSGHVAILYPTPKTMGLYVCNIGWDNFIGPPTWKYSFGGGASYLSEWKFYSFKMKGV